MNVGSLFSGVGGLDLGLHRAGMSHLWFCESDPWRREVIGHWWPGVPVYEDVRDVGIQHVGSGQATEGDVASAEGEQQRPGHGLGARSVCRPDLLCGGFPCQDVSVAGRRAGLAGNRSGLFHEFARIAESLRPRWLLVENVPGLLSSNGGRDFGVVVGTLADLGYGVAWRIVDSRFFGVPQRRRRVFIVGTVADDDPGGAAERAGQVLAVGTRCDRHPATRREARPNTAVASLSGLGTGGPDDNDGQGGRLVASPLSHGSNPNSNMAGRRREDDENLVTAFSHTQGLDAQPSLDAWPSLRKNGGGMGVATFTSRGRDGGAQTEVQTDGLHPALRAGRGGGRRDSGVAGDGIGVRRLTPVECERLQDWPDGWTNPHGDAADSRRYAACGDGVTASVAEWIGRRIMAAP